MAAGWVHIFCALFPMRDVLTIDPNLLKTRICGFFERETTSEPVYNRSSFICSVRNLRFPVPGLRARDNVWLRCLSQSDEFRSALSS